MGVMCPYSDWDQLWDLSKTVEKFLGVGDRQDDQNTEYQDDIILPVETLLLENVDVSPSPILEPWHATEQH